MKRASWVLAVGIAVFALSWLLPAFGEAPGWNAFLLAIPQPGSVLGRTGWIVVLSSLSVLSNLLFLGCVTISLRRGRPAWPAWALFGFGVLNLWWIQSAWPNLHDFRVGYYLWVLSFFLSGIGIRLRRKAARYVADVAATPSRQAS